MATSYVVYPHRRSFFSNFSVTVNLVIINVVVFIFALILLYTYGENSLAVYDYIALKPSNVFAGKYLWTFLTSMFMHAGFFHLFANMISLIFIGGLIEKLLGYKRYLLFYIFSGLFAGLFFVVTAFIFNTGFDTYAVGASGALFGLVGVLVLLTPELPVYIMFIPIRIKMKYAAPGILVVLWLISIAGNVPIGNTAHLGGLIAGLAYGFYLRKKYKRKVALISRYFR